LVGGEGVGVQPSALSQGELETPVCLAVPMKLHGPHPSSFDLPAVAPEIPPRGLDVPVPALAGESVGFAVPLFHQRAGRGFQGRRIPLPTPGVHRRSTPPAMFPAARGMAAAVAAW